MKANYTGIWKPSKQFLGLDTTWKEGDLWFKENGEWHMHVPPNAVILYTSTADINSGYVANGANSTLNLTDDRYIRLSATNVLSTGGASSHAGSSHGSTSYTVPSYTHPGGSNNIGFTAGCINVSSHNHTTNTHIHPDAGSNLVSEHRVTPVQYSSKLYGGAVVMGKQALSHAELVYNGTVAGYYPKLTSSPGTKVSRSTSHHHGAAYVYTSYFSGALSSQLQPNSGTWYRQHRHRNYHNMQTVTPVPYTYTVIPYKLQSPMYFDELPSGTAMLFTTNRFPDGWAQWVNTGRLIKWASSAGTASGSSAHDHSEYKLLDSWRDLSGAYAGFYENYTSERIVLSHYHSYYDYHLVDIANMPPYRDLSIAYKL